ncbi:hypothetical protein Pla108_00300 [Botrimarina colliarenosi]|uniref:Uncharacterized protein n=1 Tax=Botrimarina colliarenosi TaxID=2528001 RepID=A0A5C6AHY6_9BACT|nr:hypothetical protein [Botrimarina colliarenosi]TWT99097.1 hypothetical protein Pla108_00300 [Botrimarina colliarenosi]
MAQTKTSAKTKAKTAAKTTRAKASAKPAAKKPAKAAAKPAAKKPAAKAKAGKKAGEEEVTLDRRGAAERRDEATAKAAATAEIEVAQAAKPQLERREKVNRRRQIDPTTCERDYSDSEVEFMNALDAYKRKSGRMFPTCSEVLEVIREMGYVQLSAAELTAVRNGRGETEEVSIEDAAETEAHEALAESEALHAE